jgi:hypothetical protein
VKPNRKDATQAGRRLALPGAVAAGAIGLLAAIALLRPARDESARGRQASAGHATSSGVSASLPTDPERQAPPLPEDIEAIMNRISWTDDDEMALFRYMDSKPSMECVERVRGEMLRRSKAERLAPRTKPEADDRLTMDASEAQRLINVIRYGPKMEGREAARLLGDHVIPAEMEAGLVSLFRQTAEPHVRAAVLRALERSNHPDMRELILGGLRATHSEEIRAFLFVLEIRANHRNVRFEDFAEALGELRQRDLDTHDTGSLYVLLRYAAKKGEESYVRWLREDALEGRSDVIQAYALGAIPPSDPQLPELMRALRDHPSLRVQEKVLDRASSVLIDREGISRLLVLASFLTPGTDQNLVSGALDRLKWESSFLWTRKQPEPARQAIHQAVTTFLSTSPSPPFVEQATSILSELSRTK